MASSASTAATVTARTCSDHRRMSAGGTGPAAARRPSRGRRRSLAADPPDGRDRLRPRGRGGMTTLTRTPTAAPTRVSEDPALGDLLGPAHREDEHRRDGDLEFALLEAEDLPTSSEDATTAASDHALNPTTIEKPTAMRHPVTTAATRRAPTARVAVRGGLDDEQGGESAGDRPGGVEQVLARDIGDPEAPATRRGCR